MALLLNPAAPSRLVPRVENLARNPIPANITVGYALNQTGQPCAASFVASGGPFGDGFLRRTITGGGGTTTTTADLLNYGSSEWVAGSGTTIGGAIVVAPGQVHAISAYVRASTALVVRMSPQFVKAATGASGTAVGNNSVTLVPNTWTRISAVVTAGSDAQALRVDVDNAAANTTVAGDTFDVACMMITEGSTVHDWTSGVVSYGLV